MKKLIYKTGEFIISNIVTHEYSNVRSPLAILGLGALGIPIILLVLMLIWN